MRYTGISYGTITSELVQHTKNISRDGIIPFSQNTGMVLVQGWACDKRSMVIIPDLAESILPSSLTSAPRPTAPISLKIKTFYISTCPKIAPCAIKKNIADFVPLIKVNHCIGSLSLLRKILVQRKHQDLLLHQE
jgi:hypothetical protein